MANHPKLRPDVKVGQIDASTYQLENPDSEATLTLDSAGYLVAEQFQTGENSIEDVLRILKETYSVKLSKTQILEFLYKADRMGLLEISLEKLGMEVSDFKEAEDSFTPQTKISIEKEIEEIENQYSGRFGFLKRVSPTVWKGLILALIILFFPWVKKATGPLIIQPLEYCLIRSQEAGKLEQIFVREGDLVQKNQLVAQLEGLTYDIERKKFEIKKIEAELEKLQKGATSEEINEVIKKVELAKRIFYQSSKKENQFKNLYENGLISRQEYETSKASKEISKKELEKAEAELTLIQHGTRPEIIRAKLAEKESLIIDLKFLEKSNNRALIRSPILGTVSTPETKRLIGSKLFVGDPVIEVINLNKLTIQILIKEEDITSVKIGSILNFKVQSLPSKTFQGIISKIAPRAEESAGKKVFRVYSDIENENVFLRPGMTGIGKIRPERIWDSFSTLGFLFFNDIITFLRVSLVI